MHVHRLSAKIFIFCALVCASPSLAAEGVSALEALHRFDLLSGTIPSPCKKAPELKQAIPDELAPQLLQELRLNPLFKMNDAGGLCYSRSQLVGLYLEKDLNLYSEQLHVECEEGIHQIAVVDPDTGAYYDYGDHWANIISVRGKDGTIRKVVLDPQFMTEPMSIDAYFNKIVLPGKGKSKCSYRLTDRRSIIETRIKQGDRNAEIRNLLSKTSSKKEKEQLRLQLTGRVGPFDPRIRWDKAALEEHADTIINWNAYTRIVDPAGEAEMKTFRADGSNIERARIRGQIRSLQYELKQLNGSPEYYRLQIKDLKDELAELQDRLNR